MIDTKSSSNTAAKWKTQNIIQTPNQLLENGEKTNSMKCKWVQLILIHLAKEFEKSTIDLVEKFFVFYTQEKMKFGNVMWWWIPTLKPLNRIISI